MKTSKYVARIKRLLSRITHAKENHTKALNCIPFKETKPLRQNIEELEEELEIALKRSNSRPPVA